MKEKDKSTEENSLMDELITRLSRERTAALRTWRERGTADGLDSAFDLDYLDFICLAKLEAPADVFDIEDCLPLKNALWWREQIEEYESCSPEFDGAAYAIGWFEAVMRVWNDVKDKI